MKYIFAALLLLPLAIHAAENSPLDVTSDRLEVDQQNGHAVFIGNVKAVRGGITLTAMQADVSYGTSKNSDIDTVVATGNVVITREGGDTARGEKAVYTPSNGKLVLTGGTVTLTRGGHTVQGNRLDYDTVAGQAVMQGGGAGVRAHFQSGSK
ncbi:MAG TPA: LptA/OstA family protein [Alphaproteobacteria bacterium]|nr:LptA/OstA family protein [Alphaproteobacteria bacterium]